jgi:predicted HAD superfamily phosphohydrolase YqeG
MAVDVSAMVAAVQVQKGVVASVKQFVTDLRAALATATADDPAIQAAVDQVMNDILASNADLSAAIQANPVP